MSSGSLKSRLKETRSATIDSESAFLANVQVVFPVPHSSFRETARDLNPREKSRKVKMYFHWETLEVELSPFSSHVRGTREIELR